MVKKKPDAYAMDADRTLTAVYKCDKCGFKAVGYQWDDNGDKCPSCQR